MSFVIKTDLEDRFSAFYNALFIELHNALGVRYSVSEPFPNDADGYLEINREDFKAGIALRVKNLHPLSFLIHFQYPHEQDLQSSAIPPQELEAITKIIEECFSDHQIIVNK